MTPLWWGWAALVWGYALGWFLVTDPLKLLAYRYLDATKKAAPKRQDEPTAGAAKPDDAKPAPAKADDAKPAPAKAEDAKPAPAKAEDAKPAPAKAEDAKADAAVAPVGDATHAKAGSLLDMKLGDLLVAGMAKDKQGASRSIAEAISEMEETPATEPAAAPPVTPRAAE